MKSYIDGLLLNLKRANPGQEVFIQASTEILYSLIPLLKRDGRYVKNKILESLNGLTVSERTVSFDEKTNKKMWNSYSNRETVNIIVAGKTGVGKSSLINYIFGKNL